MNLGATPPLDKIQKNHNLTFRALMSGLDILKPYASHYKGGRDFLEDVLWLLEHLEPLPAWNKKSVDEGGAFIGRRVQSIRNGCQKSTLKARF